MPDLKPTSGSAWARPKTETVELPSGNVAELRDKFPAWMLMRTGKITPELMDAFEDAKQGEVTDPQLALEITDLILVTMFVMPKVTMNGQPRNAKTIHVEDLTDEDITFVLARAFGGAPDPGFRGDATGDGDRTDGEVLGDDPVGAPGGGAGDGRKPRAEPKARRAPRSRPSGS